MILKFLVGVILVIGLARCANPPRDTLTNDQKAFDLSWLFRMLEADYAPLAYKEKRFGIDFARLKVKYLKAAEETKTNRDFYLLVNRFVAELKDPHASIALPNAKVPGRALTCYLGFDGRRVSNGLKIEKLLPSVARDPRYPLKIGDLIVKLDDETLPALVRRDLAPFRDLGHDEATVTELMPKLFNRISLAFPFPSAPDALLTVRRDGKEFNVKLPWIQRDLHTFAKEQAQEERVIAAPTSTTLFQAAEQWLTGRLDFVPASIASLSPKLRGWSDFRRIDTTPTWGADQIRGWLAEASGKPQIDSWIDLRAGRELPKELVPLHRRHFFPSFVFSEPLPKKDPKAPPRLRSIGYLRVPGFDTMDEEKVAAELAATVKSFRTLSVDHVILDLLDNPGGPLFLGLRLAQLFSPDRLVMPELKFRLSDNWLDTFETESHSRKASDSAREISRRVHEVLVKNREAGAYLSESIDSSKLFPFQLEPNRELDKPIKVYVLVNEVCASTCDIVSAVLKDNRIGTIVGARTMGAGGNVSVRLEAPHSHFGLMVTESLVYRRDGSAIENEGVAADVAVDTVAARESKYQTVFRKAVDEILRD